MFTTRTQFFKCHEAKRARARYLPNDFLSKLLFICVGPSVQQSVQQEQGNPFNGVSFPSEALGSSQPATTPIQPNEDLPLAATKFVPPSVHQGRQPHQQSFLQRAASSAQSPQSKWDCPSKTLSTPKSRASEEPALATQEFSSSAPPSSVNSVSHHGVGPLRRNSITSGAKLRQLSYVQNFDDTEGISQEERQGVRHTPSSKKSSSKLCSNVVVKSNTSITSSMKPASRRKSVKPLGTSVEPINRQRSSAKPRSVKSNLTSVDELNDQPDSKTASGQDHEAAKETQQEDSGAQNGFSSPTTKNEKIPITDPFTKGTRIRKVIIEENDQKNDSEGSNTGKQILIAVGATATVACVGVALRAFLPRSEHQGTSYNDGSLTNRSNPPETPEVTDRHPHSP